MIKDYCIYGHLAIAKSYLDGIVRSGCKVLLRLSKYKCDPNALILIDNMKANIRNIKNEDETDLDLMRIYSANLKDEIKDANDYLGDFGRDD